MLVTTTTKYRITLKCWDGKKWGEDIAGDVLTDLQNCTSQELQYLKDDVSNFNYGCDLDWMQHTEQVQELLLTVEEVQE